jgi:hypothetical protein
MPIDLDALIPSHAVITFVNSANTTGNLGTLVLCTMTGLTLSKKILSALAGIAMHCACIGIFFLVSC